MAAFWDNVERTATCWLWQGPTTQNGYGLSTRSDRTIVAHRRAYLELVGPIPDGLQLDHLCRVRNCVRPDHLEPVTPAENWKRSKANQPWLVNALKTHCKRGHEFTPDNIYWRGHHRECRTCKAYLARRSRQAA